MLNPGDTAEASLIVQSSDTARGLSLAPEDEFPEVFATSRMVALVELAAARVLVTSRSAAPAVGISPGNL